MMQHRTDLQLLVDENDIRKLVAAYSDAVSLLDPVRAAATYVEQGRVCIVGTETVGRAAIQEGMRHSFATFRALQQVTHGGLVTVDGDRAQARWSTIELGVRHRSDELHCILGRYEDLMRRTPAGWRFVRRTFSMAGRARLETQKTQIASEIASLLSKDF